MANRINEMWYEIEGDETRTRYDGRTMSDPYTKVKEAAYLRLNADNEIVTIWSYRQVGRKIGRQMMGQYLLLRSGKAHFVSSPPTGYFNPVEKVA